MGKFYDNIPENLLDWLQTQEVFWVATAPLATNGHVNCSPKGLRGTFHVEGQDRVWYEDLMGSGSETCAHLRENGRITLLFSAMTGPPRIVRLFGTGVVHEFGSAEYERRLPGVARLPGSRSIIVVDVHKVGTSCGFAVPYFDFRGHRTVLLDYAAGQERREREFDDTDEGRASFLPDAAAGKELAEKLVIAPNGIKAFWRDYTKSIDGLPSYASCFGSSKRTEHAPLPPKAAADDKEHGPRAAVKAKPSQGMEWGRDAALVVAGCVLGCALKVFV